MPQELVVPDRHPPLAPLGTNDLVPMLDQIRPEWRTKPLIRRVTRILSVDPASACQRLLNAAFHDLKKKIIIAGLDIAAEAARIYKLPGVTKVEDVLDTYTNANIINLAYRMGILNRADWRRMQRAYDIRRDLEHEDDDYEATPEDCLYIFTTSIQAVLSRDPIQVVRVADFKTVVESAAKTVLSSELMDEYRAAPHVRQVEIVGYLIGTARDAKKADVIQLHAVDCLRDIRDDTLESVKVQVAEELQERLGRAELTIRLMKVAAAAGIVPYLKRARVLSFFEEFLKRFKKVGFRWTENGNHADLLDDFEDFGGFESCPDALRQQFVEWMVLCHIGEPGGYGTFGQSRRVFYSNSGAPRAEQILRASAATVQPIVAALRDQKNVKRALADKFVARRFDALFDELEKEATKD
jgi:hypothetical protein